MRFGPLANESENYRKSREELFAAEVALRDQRERVAELRRELPLDTNVKDYVLHELRLISCAATDFKTDFHFGDAAGNPLPGVSAFARSADGSVKHFYSGSALMEDSTRRRAIDLLSPFWNILDLTPEGRKEWMPKLSYELTNVQKH
jgi:predicted dithiol-disulfide oxidoreductase (DUF899 family)